MIVRVQYAVATKQSLVQNTNVNDRLVMQEALDRIAIFQSHPSITERSAIARLQFELLFANQANYFGLIRLCLSDITVGTDLMLTRQLDRDT